MKNLSNRMSENIIRSVLKLFPAGDVISGIIFSLSDAAKEQYYEEAAEIIIGRLDETMLKEIENTQNISQQISNLGQTANVLFVEFSKLLNKQHHITQNNLSDILEKVNSNTEILNQNSNMLTEICNILKGKDNSNSEVQSKLFCNYYDNLKRQIDDFNLEKVIDEIQQLKNVEGFTNIEKTLQYNIMALEGIVYLKLNQMGDATAIKKKFENVDNKNEQICDFLIYYATINGDSSLKEIIIKEYSVLNVSSIKIAIKEAFYFLVQKDYRRVQLLLTYEKEGTLCIKTELTSCDEAYYFVGLVKFYEKEYKFAIYFFKETLKRKYSYGAKYHLLIASAFILIDRKFALLLLKPEDKLRLRKIHEEFSSDSFVEHKYLSQPDMAEEYWINRLTILLHIEPATALKEYEMLSDDIKQRRDIKYIEADIYYFNNLPEKAENIFLMLYNERKDVNLLPKILASKMQQRKYDETTIYCNNLDKHDYDTEGIIASIYLQALQETVSEQMLLQKAKELIDALSSPIYVYKFLGEYYCHSNEELSKKNYRLCIDSIKNENDETRIIYFRELLEAKYYELAFDCIRPLISFNYDAKKLFVSHAVYHGNDSDFMLCSKIIDEELGSNYDTQFWFSIKAEIEYNRKRFYTAYKYIESIYNQNKSVDNAYNYAYMKLQIGNYNFKEELKLLEMSENAMYLMLAASCYNKIGNTKKSEWLSLIALARNGAIDNNTIYAGFIQINLFMNAEENRKIEYDIVNENCVIYLSSESENTWIGITSDTELLINQNNIFVGTKFYFKRDNSIIKLIGLSKNDEFLFEDVKYEIKEIWTITAKAIRYILDLFGKTNYEAPFFKKIKINNDDPIKSMEPFLVASELHDKNVLAMYNFSNQIGLPLNIFSENQGRSILDAIIYLLNLPNQPFYAGQVNNYDFRLTNIILSPSAIVVLSLLNTLDDIITKYDNLFITESTLRYFNSIFTQFNEIGNKSKLSIGYQDGRPNIFEMSDEQYKNKREFIIKIIDSLSKTKKLKYECSPEEIDNDNILIKYISKSDYDGIKLSIKKKYLYLCDDLFVRKSGTLIDESILSTNSSSLLFALYKNDLNRLLDFYDRLSEYKYNSIFNKNIILSVISKLLDEKRIIGANTLYSKFLNIIHNSLTISSTFGIQLKVSFEILNYLYSKRYVKNVEYLFENILKSVILFLSFNNMDIKIIYDSLVGEDNDKLKYFDIALKKIKKNNQLN